MQQSLRELSACCMNRCSQVMPQKRPDTPLGVECGVNIRASTATWATMKAAQGWALWGKAMPRDVWHRKLTGTVLGIVLGTLMIIAGSAGAAFAADDDDEGFYDQRLIRSFLRGLGLSNGRE